MIRKLSPKEVKKANKVFKQAKDIVIVAENINYAKNVANIFRIADAIKAKKVFLLGETHTPPFGKDLQKVSRSKEKYVKWDYAKSYTDVFPLLKAEGYTIVAIEQCEGAQLFTEYEYPEKVALVIGSEMFGMSKKIVTESDAAVVLPMYGKGGSVNVHVALGVVAFFACSIQHREA